MRGVAVLFVGAGILMIFMAIWFGGSASGGETSGEDAGPVSVEHATGFLETEFEDDLLARPSEAQSTDPVPGALEAGAFLDVEPVELPGETSGDPEGAGIGSSTPPREPAGDTSFTVAPDRQAASTEPPEATGAALEDPWEAVGTPGAAPGAYGDDLGIGEVDLAAALAHGGAEGLLEYLRRVDPDLPESRRNLVLAFAAALLGNGERSRELGAGLADALDVGSLELDLLEAARLGQDVLDLRAADEARGALGLAMRAALLERSGLVHQQNSRNALAARCFSELLLGEVHAPWSADRDALLRWTAALDQAQRGHRWSRSGNWPFVEEVVQSGDSLVRIRKRVLKSHPDLLLCTGLIERANQLTGRYIHPNDELRVPVDRPSMLVDLSARWALFLLGDEVAAAWEVGIGKDGHETQTGVFTVGEKKEEPMWFRPGEPPVPFGDPDNPLGTRWIAWHRDGVKTSLGFHGTSDPDGVGHRVSLGCIRMHNEDVEELFEILPIGALVRVQP